MQTLTEWVVAMTDYHLLQQLRDKLSNAKESAQLDEQTALHGRNTMRLLPRDEMLVFVLGMVTGAAVAIAAGIVAYFI